MPRPSSASDISWLHILVVEDEALVAFALIDDLEALGAVPLGPSPSVAHALDVVRNATKLDGALLNVRLRGELSFPIAEDLRDRGIPFVFVTGDDASATLHYPDVPVHSKPSDMAEVVASLTKLIAARVDGTA